MTRYKRFRFVHLGALLVLGLLLTGCSADTAPIEEQPTTNTATSSEPAVSYETFPLPQPILDGETSVSEALFERRSQRDFQDTELTQEQLAQLLWSAAGVTTEDGRRTAPSAGALYPLRGHTGNGA
ncbi:nitroreductase family protein [Enterococcus casseliflavus]|uniref:nitroreductase family protein n=1 Tax=Enterococcus casseliflavus TaxID=37734 RepID=UPI0035D72F16